MYPSKMDAVFLRFFSAFWLASAQSGGTVEGKPHIVMIVVDDLGWNDVGFRNNSDLQTPFLDSLAASGHVLSNYYVQATCTPSRACFLTGRFPLHTGIGTPTKPNKPIGLSLSEITVAHQLRSLGYRAHAVGKWHVGMMSFNHTPTFRGFESFYGFYGGSEDYFTHSTRKGKKATIDFRRDSSEFCGLGCSKVPVGDIGRYSTDLFTEEAVNVINSHDISKPLFLYLAYQAVHGPDGSAPERLRRRFVGAFPDNLKRREYAAVLAGVDDGVGSVTAALRSREMYDSTFLVVTTDNGASHRHGGSNYPLSAGKGSIWEGGVRGIAIVRGPGLRNDGSNFQGLAHAVDWLPTFAGASGGNAFASIDGFNIWPGLSGEEGAVLRDHVYLGVAGRGGGYIGQKMRAIRQGSLKLVIRTRPGDVDDPERLPTRAEIRARRAYGKGASLTAVGRLWTKLAGVRQTRTGGFLTRSGAAPELEVFLYDVEEDIKETQNIAAERLDDVHRLLGLMASIRVDEVPLDMESDFCERAMHRVKVQMPDGTLKKAAEPACDLRNVPPGTVLTRDQIQADRGVADIEGLPHV